MASNILVAAANNTVVDFKWMSRGGLVIDSTGDIAFTDNSFEAVQAMVVSRLKADLDGWQLYQIGADLDSVIGTTIQKQINTSLTNQFLSAGSFTVETIALSNMIQIYVYLQGSLIATASVNTSL
jgi:hypothetical protein